MTIPWSPKRGARAVTGFMCLRVRRRVDRIGLGALPSSWGPERSVLVCGATRGSPCAITSTEPGAESMSPGFTGAFCGSPNGRLIACYASRTSCARATPAPPIATVPANKMLEIWRRVLKSMTAPEPSLARACPTLSDSYHARKNASTARSREQPARYATHLTRLHWPKPARSYTLRCGWTGGQAA
jgi:hypothetical protein